MGLFEQFPYTNFHELNLDWLCKHIKELEEQIHDLTNKNIDEAINQRIDEMIDNGEFSSILNNTGVQMQNLVYSKIATISRDKFLQSVDMYNGYFYCLYSNNLRKYALDGTLVKEIEISYYHPNSCCVYNNKLYIAVGTTTIYVYNLNLTLKSTITLNDVTWFITADNYYNRLYAVVGGIIKDVLTGEKICAVPALSTGTDNGFAAYRGQFYFVKSSPNNVYTFDNSGRIIKILPVDVYQGNAYTGELEDCNIDNGGNLIQAAAYNNYGNDAIFSSIFKSNVIYGDINGASTPTTLGSRVVFVDASNTNVNPDGSQTNPFPTINEGITALYAPNGWYNRIEIASGTYTENLYFQFDATIFGNGTVTVNGIVDCNRASVTINNIKFVNPTTDKYSLSAFQGSVQVAGCTFEVSENYTKDAIIFADNNARGAIYTYCTFVSHGAPIVANIKNNSYANLVAPPNSAFGMGANNSNISKSVTGAGTTGKTINVGANSNMLAAGKRIKVNFNWFNFNQTTELTIPGGNTAILRTNPILYRPESDSNIIVGVLIELTFDKTTGNIVVKQYTYNINISTGTVTATDGYNQAVITISQSTWDPPTL